MTSSSLIVLSSSPSLLPELVVVSRQDAGPALCPVHIAHVKRHGEKAAVLLTRHRVADPCSLSTCVKYSSPSK